MVLLRYISLSLQAVLDVHSKSTGVFCWFCMKHVPVLDSNIMLQVFFTTLSWVLGSLTTMILWIGAEPEQCHSALKYLNDIRNSLWWRKFRRASTALLGCTLAGSFAWSWGAFVGHLEQVSRLGSAKSTPVGTPVSLSVSCSRLSLLSWSFALTTQTHCLYGCARQ